MTSVFTPNIYLEQPGNNDYVGDWNTPVNNDWTVVDNVFGAATTIALSNANVTLSVSQSAYQRIILTGTLTANVELILPATIGGSRYIWNTTTGSYTVRVLNGSSDTGGGIICPQGLLTPIVLTAGQAYYDDYQAVPPGAILHYAGSTAPPGFLFTAGQSISTATYPLLFAAIGYTYGGFGISFTLPDTRGCVLAAADNMGGTSAGRLPGYVLSSSGGNENITLASAVQSVSSGTAQIIYAIGNRTYNVLQPTLCVNHIIRY